MITRASEASDELKRTQRASLIRAWDAYARPDNFTWFWDAIASQYAVDGLRALALHLGGERPATTRAALRAQIEPLHSSRAGDRAATRAAIEAAR